MLYDLAYLLVGIVLLLGGGDALVRGASSLARAFGVSPLIVGLTVVAFGTSAPELAVNVSAAATGNSEISFGNIIGSNIANTGLILGICALIRPLTTRGRIVRREIPMMLLATAVASASACDLWLDGGTAVYSRSDGITQLLLFCVFIYYLATDVLRERGLDPLGAEAEARENEEERPTAPGIAALLTLIGLGGLVAGGHLTVEGATGVAKAFGVSDVIIGLTLVAVGTSLPELVTSGIATWRGRDDLALGNVVGSNIFNLLLVQGSTAIVRPIPVPEGGLVDLAVMAGLSLLIFPMALSFRGRLVRAEGAILLAIYVVYIVWRAAAAV